MIADKRLVALTAMGQLRLRLGKQLNLIDNKRYDLLWVTEFPLLEWSDEENRFLAMLEATATFKIAGTSLQLFDQAAQPMALCVAVE